jgi:hypothetical protein
VLGGAPPSVRPRTRCLLSQLDVRTLRRTLGNENSETP